MVYVQLVAFPVLALGAIWGGWLWARRRYWWVGVAAGLMVIGMVVLGHRVARLHFVAPISWAVDADWGPLLMTVAIGGVFGTLMPRLPRRSTRVYVGVLMGVMLAYYGLMPAVMPLAVRGRLTAEGNAMDRYGVCRQRYAFTCGPASAVTCLGKLGVAEEEAGLAVAARSAPVYGTDGHVLAAAVVRRHAGVGARYRYAERVEDVHVPAVAEMELPGWGGHYVAVLGIWEERVLVGDPMGGRHLMTQKDFLANWRHGVVEIWEQVPAAGGL